jgi:hypothetical protein
MNEIDGGGCGGVRMVTFLEGSLVIAEVKRIM